MPAYRRKDRGKEWWFRFRYKEPNGKTIRYNKLGGKTKRQAEVAERELRRQLDESKPADPSIDFSAFITEEYWPQQKLNLTPRAKEREQGILNNHIGPYFAGMINSIDRKMIIAYIEKRKKQNASNESIRKELAILKHILSEAIESEVLRTNPFDAWKKYKPAEGEKRTRHLVEDEWPRLLKCIPVTMKPAIIILVNTGIRRGELMNLKWTDIDIKKGLAYLPKTKNANPRWCILSSDVIEVLKGMPKQKDNPKVFWMFTANALTVAFRRAVQKAEILDFRLHDLRHSYATAIRQQGFGIDILKKLLGHSDTRMTERYAHVGDDLMQEAHNSINGFYGAKLPSDDETETVH